MLSNRRQRQSGVTLIELLTTVAVLGLLLALALPSFREAFARGRLTGQANDMVAALSIARAEALRRTRTVTLCPSGDQVSCAADWTASGWIVWADDDIDGSIDNVAGSSEILLVGAFSAADAVAPSTPAAAIAFDMRGRRAAPVGAAAFQLRVNPKGYDCSHDGLDMQRVVRVTPAGIVTASKPKECE